MGAKVKLRVVEGEFLGKTYAFTERTNCTLGRGEDCQLRLPNNLLYQDVSRHHCVLEIEPQHAAAHINLGTLYYNRQDFASAEQHYRAAVAADPRYALAYFDLGNVLDETGHVDDSIAAYRNAIQLAPTYADAHYNLALAYERKGEPRLALQHWKTYLKLDNNGPWAVHARNQVARILEADKLKIVYKQVK